MHVGGACVPLADPPNGQVLMVLSMDNNCSATSFDMELCAEKLKSLGVQVSAALSRGPVGVGTGLAPFVPAPRPQALLIFILFLVEE